MPRLTAAAPRIGLVGLGRWGANYVGAFRRAGLGLVALCDLDAARLATARSEAPSAHVSTSFDALLDAGVDAVVIATPPPTHADLALQAIGAGVHVLVEKPLASSVDAAEAVFASAARAGVVLAVGHQTLWSPVWPDALARIGELRSIHAERVSLGAAHSDSSALVELASHDLASVIGPLGQTLARVRARSLDASAPTQAIELDAITRAGVVVHLRASRLGPSRARRVELTGARRSVLLDELDRGGDPLADDPLAQQCRRFIGRIAERDTSPYEAQIALDVVRVVAGAEASLEGGGRWVELAPSPGFGPLALEGSDEHGTLSG